MEKPPILITKEQALGYLIATLEADYSFWDSMDKAALVLDLEKQFLKLQPEEAERIYVERWEQADNPDQGGDGA